MKNDPVSSVLRANGLRATPHRVALIGTLATATAPKTAEEIHARMESVDLVTVYRNLQALTAANLVKEVRFKDASVRYELIDEGSHHHHLVCKGCGAIDELEGCDVTALEKEILKRSKRFASVDEHALEFFGTCKGCVEKR
jgi:Fur family ferric uptake transcriptional regulator